jgi:hypothetical protein
VSGSITPGGLKPVTQSPVRQGLQALDRERRPSSISAQSFEPRAVSAGNSDIRVEAETRHAGATGAGSTVDRFRIDSVPRQHNAAASVDPGGEAAADGTRVDLRQPGLIARQRIRVDSVANPGATVLSKSKCGSPVTQCLKREIDPCGHALPSFSIRWRVAGTRLIWTTGVPGPSRWEGYISASAH